MSSLSTKRWTKVVLVLILSVTALISIGRIWEKAYLDNKFDGAAWGIDLYQFWYGSQFLWQGKEPYTAMLRNETPHVPAYIAGRDDQPAGSLYDLPKKWGIQYIPGAPAVFLLMTPLSLLPWTTAAVLFGAVNLLLCAVYVWLLARLHGVSLFTLNGLLLLSVLLSLLATRQLLELGQISLLIIVLMIAAFLLLEKQPTLAGILQGIAISKFTISFPLILYFVYKRKWKALLACVITQLIGLAAIALVTHTDVAQVAAANLSMAWSIMTTQQDAGWSAHLLAMNWGVLKYIAVGLVTCVAGVGLVLWYGSRQPHERTDTLSWVLLIAVMSFWSLLVLYHARQDWMVAMLLVSVILMRTTTTEKPKPGFISLQKYPRIIIIASLLFSLAIWILPLYTIVGTNTYSSLYSIATIVAFALSMGLLFCKRTDPIVRGDVNRLAG